MATQCRNAKINRNKRMKLYANMILVLLVLIGGVLGFFLAKLTTPPQETITVTKTVEVPAYKSNVLVDTADVFLFDVPLSDSLQRYIYEICADENVPVTLVMAMIEHESGFDPEAVSPTEDYGLMQINAVNPRMAQRGISLCRHDESLSECVLRHIHHQFLHRQIRRAG